MKSKISKYSYCLCCLALLVGSTVLHAQSERLDTTYFYPDAIKTECNCDYPNSKFPRCSYFDLKNNEILPEACIGNANKYLISAIGEKLSAKCVLQDPGKSDSATCGGILSYYLCYSLNINRQSPICIGVSLDKNGNINTDDSFNSKIKELNLNAIITAYDAVRFARKSHKSVKQILCREAYLTIDKNNDIIWRLEFYDEKYSETHNHVTTFQFDIIALNGKVSDYKEEKGTIICRFCFSPNTQILLADQTQKPISQIHIGDKILSDNMDTQTLREDIVQKIDSVIHDSLVEVQLTNGTTVQSTDDHPYFIEGKGWCSFRPERTFSNYGFKVKRLAVGDESIYYQNGKLTKMEVGAIKKLKKKMMTYNISALKFNHNYFANGILVGNENPPIPLTPK